jgi:hypothetical protein
MPKGLCRLTVCVTRDGNSSALLRQTTAAGKRRPSLRVRDRLTEVTRQCLPPLLFSIVVVPPDEPLLTPELGGGLIIGCVTPLPVFVPVVPEIVVPEEPLTPGPELPVFLDVTTVFVHLPFAPSPQSIS